VKRLRNVAWLTGTSAWTGLLGFFQGDNLTYAASIAYYALLSLFPCLLLALVFVGRATHDEASRNTVLTFVLRYFPSQFDFILRQLDAFRASEVSFGLTGTLGLIWGALGFFGAVSSAVNYAWGFEHAPPRTFWKHKAMSLLMLVVTGLMLLTAMLLVSASHIVGASWFSGVLVHFPGLHFLGSFTVRNATTLLFILVVGFLYYFVPNTSVRFRDVWVGAVVTGLLWKGALEAFSWYAGDMSRFRLVNGSIAVVVVFLVWVYVQAAILLYGVQFTAVYARLRREQLLR
jgi:membrane protein